MTSKAVLVTGGAGYIGAHTAKALAESGYLPIVYDNLSSGHTDAVRWGPFVYGDIRDGRALREAMETHEVQAVIHFASLIEVGRSVVRPDLFWEHNVGGCASILEAMKSRGIRRIVFSSSAAVYGDCGNDGVIREDCPKDPTSPYGDTKLAGERLIAAHCRAFQMTGVALRYFNAAGADPSGLIGEAHEPETHLIPRAIEAALGGSGSLTIFGDDFDTPDGTCVRDYIHVNDLARAHVAALDAEFAEGRFEAMNVGVGVGRSVQQVVQAVGRAVGRSPAHVMGGRRPGDPPSLVADSGRIRALLSWRPTCSDLDTIVADAVRWESSPAYGRGLHRPDLARVETLKVA
jgi:UDP-glucose 4-epimerase/UDP-arabinose 4-epimerase